jgi:hypothetical protein
LRHFAAVQQLGRFEAKLTYRLKYKTKDGDRQTGRIYKVSLYR